MVNFNFVPELPWAPALVRGGRAAPCSALAWLSSTGIARLQWYYEPLRHPSAPGLSLTGVRLIIPDHALGFPVLRALSLCTCCRHYPGAADGHTRRSNLPIRNSLPRNHYRVGLHIDLFEDCSAFTHVAACTLARSPCVTGIRGIQTFRRLHACSGCFRLERSSGGTCAHWKNAALSRRTWISVLRQHARLWQRCADIGRSLQQRSKGSNLGDCPGVDTNSPESLAWVLWTRNKLSRLVHIGRPHYVVQQTQPGNGPIPMAGCLPYSRSYLAL